MADQDGMNTTTCSAEEGREADPSGPNMEAVCIGEPTPVDELAISKGTTMDEVRMSKQLKHAVSSESESAYSKEIKGIEKIRDISDVSNCGYFSSLFNLANAALGAGLLTFPQSFSRTGMVGGVILQLILTVLVIVGLEQISVAGRIANASTMAMTCRRILGRKMELLCIVLVLAFAWTTCIAFLQIIGAQLSDLAESIYNDPKNVAIPFYFQREFTVSIVSILIVYPLSCARDMSFLGWASFVAVAACAYVTLLVFSYAVTGSYEEKYLNMRDEHLKTHAELPKPDFWDIFEAIPTMCFGYQCHVSCIPTCRSTKKSVQPRFWSICLNAGLVCFAFYLTCGVAGSYMFGEFTEEIILANFDNDWPPILGRVLVACAVATSYPILSYCGRQEIVGLLNRAIQKYSWNMHANVVTRVLFGNEHRKLFCIGTGWFVTTLLIAIFVQKIDAIVTLAGNSCSLLMFFLPGYLMIKIADLRLEESFEASLAALPNSPSEDQPESWAFGIRQPERLNFISARRRTVTYITGWFFMIAGIIQLIIVTILFFYKYVFKTIEE